MVWCVKQTKEGGVFIDLRLEPTNVVINYDDYMEKLNTSDRIPGVETEWEKVSNPGTKIYPMSIQSEWVVVGRR